MGWTNYAREIVGLKGFSASTTLEVSSICLVTLYTSACSASPSSTLGHLAVARSAGEIGQHCFDLPPSSVPTVNSPLQSGQRCLRLCHLASFALTSARLPLEYVLKYSRRSRESALCPLGDGGIKLTRKTPPTPPGCFGAFTRRESHHSIIACSTYPLVEVRQSWHGDPVSCSWTTFPSFRCLTINCPALRWGSLGRSWGVPVGALVGVSAGVVRP